MSFSLNDMLVSIFSRK